MGKKYNPRKQLYRAFDSCKNPFKLVITHEDRTGRYVLADPVSKLYGRILNTLDNTIYAPIYLISIFKYDPPWYKYTGNQDALESMLEKVETIWYTDKDSKGFKTEEYEK